MRRRQLQITLFTKNEKSLYSLKFNLYKLMTGPFHNDFKIKIDGIERGRIIFDLKISQIVEFSIESISTQI